MSRLIRKVISEKISSYKNLYYELEVPTKKKEYTARTAVLHWTPKKKDDRSMLQVLNETIYPKEYVRSVRILPSVGALPEKIEFELDYQAFIESALQETNDVELENCDRVVVDFSSPNIAKPFHVGHLRSTIIGNVIGNLHKHYGAQVTKLNYLGDWGTQFGMLQVGVELTGITNEQMRNQPIEALYHAYIAANQEAKSDPRITEVARNYFTQMENNSNPKMSEQWKKYRQYTVDELEKVYARLGVQFDQYDWESEYSQKQIGDIMKRLESKSLLHDEIDGRKIVLVDNRRVPIIKSDGSTLYLARDIAAVVDRFARFQFNRIFYVVDNAQTDHFNACFKTTAAMCPEIPLENMKHVKFGRIHGMSTRQGNVIFLQDVLNEARDIMREKQLKSPTTKVDLSVDSNSDGVCDILAVSAVIINDLKQKRQRDYDFDWNKALQVNGDTGIKLQYTHCRLNNLLENVADINVDNIKPSLQYLNEPEALNLIHEISRFEQVIWQSKEHLEACILVNYLFGLCNATSRCLKVLKVKSETCREKQQNRILLFQTAKRLLKTGMTILGLKPLNKM